MKQLLITIAAVVLVGCGESQQSATTPEAKPVEPVAEAAKPEPPKVEELLNSIGTPLNEMEKIISDEKYLEKLVDGSEDSPW